MAKYTIELREIVKHRNIFNFDYPFYDEKKRPDFEKAFIRNFYFREIGVETIDRFLFELETKMLTVFPYYNELFKVNQIEYSVLDNYSLKETTTINRENTGKSSGVSSSVGQTADSQTSESEENRNGQTTGNTSGSSNTDRTENGSTSGTTSGTAETNKTGSTSGTSSESGTINTSGSVNEESSGNVEEQKRHHDTPQGKLSLNDGKYLTKLDHDTAETSGTKTTDNTSESSESKSGESSGTTSENGTTETSETTSGTSETTGNEKQISSSESSGTSKEEATSKTTFNSEEFTTADTNTRAYKNDKMSESMEVIRKGNIGIDTDADMIQKHIKLQQILKKIELMFFEECEDLFMLVF